MGGGGLRELEEGEKSVDDDDDDDEAIRRVA